MHLFLIFLLSSQAQAETRDELIETINALPRLYQYHEQIYKLGEKAGVSRAEVNDLLIKHVDRLKNDCTTINHRKSKCLPPVRGQGNSQFCYAFSAARISSFELCEEVSPVFMGILYSEYVKESPRLKGGGYADKVIALANTHGYCLEKDLPSMSDKWTNFFDLAEKYEKVAGRLSFVGPDLCWEGVRENQMFPYVRFLDIVANDLKGHLSSFYAMAHESCHDRIPKSLKTENCPKGSKEKLSYINSQLEKHPVELSSGGRRTALIADHSVVVIGRQWNEKKRTCDYLVDDSADMNGRGSETTLGLDELLPVLADPGSGCTTVQK